VSGIFILQNKENEEKGRFVRSMNPFQFNYNATPSIFNNITVPTTNVGLNNPFTLSNPNSIFNNLPVPITNVSSNPFHCDYPAAQSHMNVQNNNQSTNKRKREIHGQQNTDDLSEFTSEMDEDATSEEEVPGSEIITKKLRLMDTNDYTQKEFGPMDDDKPQSSPDMSFSRREIDILQHTIQVRVKTVSGKEIAVRLSLSKTIRDLKRFIEEKEGIPESQQRILCRGKNERDGKTIHQLGISDGFLLHLVLALRGG